MKNPSTDSGSTSTPFDRLPVFDKKNDLTEEDIRDNLFTLYHGDEKEKFEKKMKEGGDMLKKLARKRKYFKTAIEEKTKKYITDKLFEEIHERGLAKARLDAATSEKRMQKRKLHESSRKEVQENELCRQHKAKKEATSILEQLKTRRIVFRIISLFLFLLSFSTFVLQGRVMRNQGETFRNSLSNILFYKNETKAQFLPCLGIYGLQPLFLEDIADSTFPQAACETSIEEIEAKKNQTFIEYYLYNITNANKVLQGEVPVTTEIGPFKFLVARSIENAQFRKEPMADDLDSPEEWVDLHEMEILQYVGNNDDLDEKITVVNFGFQETFVKLTEWGSDDGLLISWLGINSLKNEVTSEIKQSSTVNSQVEDYHVWAGTGNWQVNETTCPCFSFDYTHTLHPNGCSWTLACFIYRENYQRVIAESLSVEDHLLHNQEKLPVFGVDPLNEEQSRELWNVIQPGLSDADCILETSCEDLSKRHVSLEVSMINLKVIVDSFSFLWRKSSELPVLSGSTAIAYDVGMSQNSLEIFYQRILSGNSRCVEETQHIGALSCTQLNDVMQYFHRLFSYRWNRLYQHRKSDRDYFSTRSIREILLTGYSDTTMGLFAFGEENAFLNRESPLGNQFGALSCFFLIIMFLGNELANRIQQDPTLEVESLDAAWLSNAWVSPIIRAPSYQHYRYLSNKTVATNEEVQVFPSVFLVSGNYSSDDNWYKNVPFKHIIHTYSTGFKDPQGISFARYLGKIGEEKFVDIFSERTYLEGFDGIQFGPSFDFEHTGRFYDENGRLNSELEDYNYWPDTYQIYLKAAKRPIEYEFTDLMAIFKNGTTETVANSSFVESQIESGNTYLRMVADKSDEFVQLPLRKFKIKGGRYTKYESDSKCYSCFINVAPLFRNIPMFLGEPRYFGCDSLLGEDDVLDTGAEELGFTKTVINDGVIDKPLPTIERAKILTSSSTDSDVKKIENYIGIEPITGQVFDAEISFSIYFHLDRTSYLFRQLPKDIKLPHFTKRLVRKRETEEAITLSKKLKNIRMRRWFVRVLMNAIASFLFLSSMYILRHSYSYRELNLAAVTPVETLDNMVKGKRDDLLIPWSKRVKEKRDEYDNALAVLEKKRDKIQNMPNLSIKVKEELLDEVIGQNGQALQGIGQDGKIFAFSTEDFTEIIQDLQKQD